MTIYPQLSGILSTVGVIWYLGIWAIGLLGCYTARKRHRNRPRSPLATSPASTTPGVSIIRPLKGLDTNLYENLESTFVQEYSNYEILLSVADEDDQALLVVSALIAKYPHVDAKVIIGEEVVGVNPKVNNLMRPYSQAKHDILWVVDSGVAVDPGTLARSVDALVGPISSRSQPSKRVALVHHVPYALASDTKLGARLEEAFLNTNHAKMYIALNIIAVDSCVVGKSNMYRRSDLDRVNGSMKPISSHDSKQTSGGVCGLRAFGKYLAEDNTIGCALWHELGASHEMSCDVAPNAIGSMSFSGYVWRRVRWIRVRKHMPATLLEPFTEGVMLSIIASICWKSLIGVPPWLVIVVHFVALLWVDLDVYASLAGHALPAASRLDFVVAWAAREALAFPIWALAMVGDEVGWRGRRYRVLRNGEVVEVD